MMTPEEITQRLEQAAREKQIENWNEATLDMVAHNLKKLDPYNQMLVICAYQASLILEITEGDQAKSTDVWRASWAASGMMLRSFHDALTGSSTH